MKTNIKLEVTPEQSEAVQKICFANGIKWLISNDTVSFTDKEYLFIDSDRIWCRNFTNRNIGSETKGYTEVDTDLFIRTNGTCEESIELVNNSSNNKSKEDMFKQYGFEVPNFNCEIAGPIEDILYGAVWVQLNSTPRMEEFGWFPEQWDIIDGMAHNNTKYNLNPIKKPWYETCTYPVLVWNENNDLFAIETRKDYNNSYLSICRPLSNADIDRLKQDF